ncbi:MAG: PHP domain-containing protein [Roseiflexaceae bacterium]
MIDLHIHTTATPHHSSWVPGVLVAHASERGMDAIAITDHNTTASVAAGLSAARIHGLRVISGVEIDSGFPTQGPSPIPTKLWHTLIYGADPKHPDLIDLCRSVFARNQADAQRLQIVLRERGFVLHGLDELGCPANVADVGTALGRHNAIPRQASDDDEVAGMRYILNEIPNGYNPIGVDEVIQVAHHVRGLAVLAHPGRSRGIYAIPATAEDVASMAAAGLDGIEVFYPAHSPAEQERLYALARTHHLLVSGGSDSHHPHQPLATWPTEAMADLLQQLRAL